MDKLTYFDNSDLLTGGVISALFTIGTMVTLLLSITVTL